MPTSDASTAADEADASTSDASTCDDSVATPSSDAGDGGALCPVDEMGVGCLNSYDCETRSTWLKPRLARIWQECLASSPDMSCVTEGGAGAYKNCSDQVVAKACPDPTAEAFCNEARSKCPTDAGAAAFVMADCVKLASALTKAGRDAYLTCVTDLGCGLDLSCALIR